MQLLEQTFAQSPQGVCYFDPERVIRWANRVFAGQVGRPLDEIVNQHAESVMPGWEEQVGHLYEQVRDSGQGWHASTYPYAFPDQPDRGQTYWDSSVTPLRGDSGQFQGWLLIHNEVTEWVEAEQREIRLTEALREANEKLAVSAAQAQEAAEKSCRLAAIVESSNDAIIGKTSEGIITDWNPAAEQLFGYSPEEIVGKPISTLVPPDATDELQEIMRRVKRGERSEHYQTVRLRKDGQPINVDVTVSPIKDADGKTIGASAIARRAVAHKPAA